MCPMKLSEFLEGGSIWGAIKSAQEFPFLTTPEDVAQLDLMQTLSYGDRTMFSKMIPIEINTVAGQIVKLYADKWNKLIDFNKTDFNLGANNTRKITGNIKVVGDKHIQNTTLNKVAAYNDDTLLSDNSTEYTGDSNSTDDTTKESTDETFNLKTAFENLSTVEQTNIINTVLKDVSNYLTLSVY